MSPIPRAPEGTSAGKSEDQKQPIVDQYVDERAFKPGSADRRGILDKEAMPEVVPR